MGHDGAGHRGAQSPAASAGWSFDSIDLFEFNEAFAVQASPSCANSASRRRKSTSTAESVAIGHPIGASGARVLVTLIYEMVSPRRHRGVAALCLGGGNSVAMCIER